MAIYDDVTVRKTAEAERERLITELEAKNAELERFTYTVSHDLKSPLVTIKGFLGALEKDILAGDHDRVETDMAYMSDAAERMQQLLDELLELSRIGRVCNPCNEVNVADLADLPIVILTTSKAEQDMAKAYEHHANSYLVKPVDFEKFSRMMNGLGFYWLGWNHNPWR